ncbi:MAG: ribonuclease D [Eggerthella lenta]
MYIANQENLAAFAERAMHSSVLAIDTEFLREKTYYAKLCLIQLATDDETAIVDPFAVDDLKVLAPVLRNENVMKLFHAGNQDLEILLREVGVLPHPLFDTQVAAALLGHTQQIGYAALVHAECGVTLKKIDSFTDWSRPSAVRFVVGVRGRRRRCICQRMYERMRAQLVELGRLSWLDRDFEDLADPRATPPTSASATAAQGVSQLSRCQLSAAREVAAWRELEAQRRDVPRKWVVTDEQIVEACKRWFRPIDDLFMVRGLSDRLSTKDAHRGVADRVRVGRAPDTGQSLIAVARTSRTSTRSWISCASWLRAKQNGVAFPTLASHDDLGARRARYREGVDLLRGWRRALVGGGALELLEGRLALSIDGSELRVEHRS